MSLTRLWPGLRRPTTRRTASTAAYIQQVLRGERAVPEPIALQVQHILREVKP